MQTTFQLTYLVTLLVAILAVSPAMAQAPAWKNRRSGRWGRGNGSTNTITVTMTSTSKTAATVVAPAPAATGVANPSTTSVVPVTSVVNTAKTATAAEPSTTAAVTKPTTSTAAVSTSVPATTGGSYAGKKGKRGLAVPWDSIGSDIDSVPSNGVVTWMYNWETYLPPGGKQFEFVAMLRTGSQDDINRMNTNLAGSKATKFMCLNEPDIADQANLSIDQVVQIWKEICWPKKTALNLQIGAPAMSNGPNGIPMLQQFMAQVGTSNPPDFVPLHWYGTDINDFQNHVQAIYDVVKKPVWVTEFASQNNDAAAQQAFMTAAMTFLDNASYVDRYSWFAYSRTAAINDASRLLTTSGGKTALYSLYTS